MLKFFAQVRAKIGQTETRLSELYKTCHTDSKSISRFFYIQKIWLDSKLLGLELIENILKFVIILGLDSSKGFEIIFNQRELHQCPHSYQAYKQVRRKVQKYSASGLSTIIIATLVTSLLSGLLFNTNFSKAATNAWQQTDWSLGFSNNIFTNTGFKAGAQWQKFSTSTNVVVQNGGKEIALGQFNGGLTQTTNTDFLLGSTTNSTVVMGVGTSSHIELKKSANSLSAGAYTSMAVNSDGTLSVWGESNYGQSGDGTTARRYSAFKLDGFSGVAAVSTNMYHSVFLKTDQTLWASGWNQYGQLGDGTTIQRYSPVPVSGLSGVIAATAGLRHTLAVKSDGTVWAWGDNLMGDLGGGTVNVPNGNPTQVSGLTGMVAVSAGNSFSVALKNDGTVWTWGYNNSGQLGDGTANSRMAPAQVGGLSGIIAITSGSSHTLALKNDGTVWVWGNDSYNSYSMPTKINSLSNIVAISAGSQHSLVLKADKTVWAWGQNNSGQLGDNTTIARGSPAQVVGLTNVVSITAGSAHSLAVKADGSMWAWGNNNYAQLGDSTLVQRLTPIRIYGQPSGSLNVGINISATTTVSFGFDSPTIIKADGTVWSWGWGGALGDGVGQHTTSPVQVLNLNNAIAVSSGSQFVIALKSDGTVWSWGNNADGELGDGTLTYRLAPVQVSGLTNIVAIKAGTNHTLAIKNDGTVWAWGYNAYGQLGNGTTTLNKVPVQISGLTNVVALGAGNGYSLAVESDGTVWAWGKQYFVENHTPVQVSGLAGITDVSTGNGSSLALKSDGTVWAWGNNSNGQIGDGTINGVGTPKQVAGVAGVVSIVEANVSSLALKSDGTVLAWGGNGNGQLCDGTQVERHSPVVASLLSNIKAISANNINTIAVKTDGSVWTIGDNQFGQLGNYTNTSSNTSLVQVKEFNLPTDYASVGSVYKTSGNYISAVLDAGQASSYLSVLRDQYLATNTAINIQVRAGEDNTPDDGSGNWLAWQDISVYEASSSLLNGKRYLQYQLNLTSDGGATPTFDDITFNYSAYVPTGTLDSSIFDSESAQSLFGNVSWLATTTVNATVVFQVRTASTSQGITLAPWLGPDSATSTYFTDPTGQGLITGSLSDGADDQFIQWRAILTSDGYVTPQLKQVGLIYVMNEPPKVELTNTPTQLTNGSVTVDFQTKDLDTDSNNNFMGRVEMGLEYFSPLDSAWHKVDPGKLNFSLGTSTTNVATSTWTTASLTWQPAGDFNHFFASSSGFKIRVVANDHEAANNRGYSAELPMQIDTAKPIINSLKIDASINPSIVYLDGADDSLFKYKTGLQADLSDAAVWSVATSSGAKAIAQILADDPETVYVQLQDEFGNTSNISAVTSPTSPKNFLVQDISNSGASIYREFLSWAVASSVPDVEFKQYNIWRKIDGGSYALYATTSKYQNSYTDDEHGANLDPVKTYTYKVTTEDVYGNISRFDKEISDVPDNVSADTTAPIISATKVEATSTQSATIVWNTNESSNSSIIYSQTLETVASSGTEFGSTIFADNAGGLGEHRVTVAGLTPNTTYYFEVKSVDASGNAVIDDNAGTFYSFTTKPGPVVSNVQITNLTANTAMVSWSTDLPANDLVVFSTSTNFIATTSAQGNVSTDQTFHPVQLTGLTIGTRYYFYVQSVDASGNVALGYDDLTAPGFEQPFTFVTVSDVTPPNISKVTCSTMNDTTLSVQWTTDNEPNIGSLGFGSSSIATATDLYPNYIATSTNQNFDQTVDLTGLSASTTYYFRITVADQFGNATTSTEYNCSTSEKLLTETEAKKREAAAKAQGAADQQQLQQQQQQNAPAPSGGGMIIIDKTDKVAPVISNISVNNISTSTAWVSWVTNENADSFVNFGLENIYGQMLGSRQLSTNHQVILTGLLPASDYHYQVSSADSSGNVASSTDLSFKTTELTAAEKNQTEELLKQIADLKKADQQNKNKDSLMSFTTKRLLDLLQSLSGQVSLSVLETNVLGAYDVLDKIAEIIPAPVLSGAPTVEVGSTFAKISWNTDKEAGSLVNLADEANYLLAKRLASPYVRTDGDPYRYTKSHAVTVANLTPDTTYHYQVTSKAKVGPVAKSQDFIFKTKIDSLEIINNIVDGITPNKANFKWLTNYPTNSSLRYIPYRGNTLAVAESKTVLNREVGTSHQLNVTDFEPGVVYQIELGGVSDKGAQVSKIIPTFSTAKDLTGPSIDQIKTESAIQQGKASKVQTIISWYTDEPAIAKVIYEQGVITDRNDLANEIPMETGYSKKHVAILTGLESGQVYTFKVIALDSSKNTTVSEAHTILAPHKQEGVFDLIIRTMEQTFGWVGKIKQ